MLGNLHVRFGGGLLEKERKRHLARSLPCDTAEKKSSRIRDDLYFGNGEMAR